MKRYYLAMLALTLAVAPTVMAQSGSRAYSQPIQNYSAPRASASGSGTIIQSTPIQQGSAMNGGSGMRAKPAMETFESKFWNYLVQSRYRGWAPVPGKTGDIYDGQSPHGAKLKMYLNRTAAGRSDELPMGSVVVKENYAADGKTLMAITTMYRPKNANMKSVGGGWYWIKYNPDGSVAKKGDMRLAGRVQGCIDCHAAAGGDDYAFFND